jgi:endonuclease YncB( thermonuclease family)
VTKSQVLNEKSWIGTVVDVHSGDSLSVLHPQKNTVERLYFPHTRAPAVNLPWSFEAREALRKRAIGQKVKVEI